jgi:hypothetical protein
MKPKVITTTKGMPIAQKLHGIVSRKDHRMKDKFAYNASLCTAIAVNLGWKFMPCAIGISYAGPGM